VIDSINNVGSNAQVSFGSANQPRSQERGAEQ
jgi:hypothetical protein